MNVERNFELKAVPEEAVASSMHAYARDHRQVLGMMILITFIGVTIFERDRLLV